MINTVTYIVVTSYEHSNIEKYRENIKQNLILISNSNIPFLNLQVREFLVTSLINSSLNQ